SAPSTSTLASRGPAGAAARTRPIHKISSSARSPVEAITSVDPGVIFEFPRVAISRLAPSRAPPPPSIIAADVRPLELDVAAPSGLGPTIIAPGCPADAHAIELLSRIAMNA